MDDPTQPLYNTTKQKLLDGKQVFSQTITQFDVKAYCDGAAKYDFSRFEMQHATLRFDEVEKMIAACPRAAATPILRIPDATETNVQRAVDVGVLGIIVPTVDDAHRGAFGGDVRAISSDCATQHRRRTGGQHLESGHSETENVSLDDQRQHARHRDDRDTGSA